MSKSKGNVVTPGAMLDAHGSDAVRYWAASSRLGTDAAFDPENPKQIKIGRRLAIKVLNAAKFVYGFEGETGAITEALDLDMVRELGKVVESATAAYDAFDHARALEVTETFFWTFTDDYLELVKERAYTGEGAERTSAVSALRLAIETVARLLAPVIPFATEEVWSWTNEDSIHRASWPSPEELPDTAASVETAGLLALASEALITIRRAKTDSQVAQKTGIISATLRGPALLAHAEADLRAVGKIASLSLLEGEGVELVSFELEPSDD
jgi:valyl-tRNA synthetase